MHKQATLSSSYVWAVYRHKNNDYKLQIVRTFSYKCIYINSFRNSGEKSIPREQQSQNKEWKLQTRLHWVCSWEIMKSATSLTHPSTCLNGTQFSILNVLESLIGMNNTEMKSCEVLLLESPILFRLFSIFATGMFYEYLGYRRRKQVFYELNDRNIISLIPYGRQVNRSVFSIWTDLFK